MHPFALISASITICTQQHTTRTPLHTRPLSKSIIGAVEANASKTNLPATMMKDAIADLSTNRQTKSNCKQQNPQTLMPFVSLSDTHNTNDVK